MQFLEEWYDHREYYHLIGFLIDCGKSIKELKDVAKEKRKTEFLTAVKTMIKEEVSCDIDGLTYKDRKMVKKVLLLFNIQTILATSEAEIKFPFHLYKKNQWDIEHIRSQTDKTIDAQHREAWIKDILGYFMGFTSGKLHSLTEEDIKETVGNDSQELCIELNKMLHSETINDGEFRTLYAKVQAKFCEESEFEDKHDISNLALLDAHTNRSYGNAFFPIKRSVILLNDASGIFIPLSTKNVFLKVYSHNLDDIMNWSEQDAKSYVDAIKRVLNEYLVNVENTGVAK